MTTYYLSDSRVYVGTYKKYNDGNLFGAWLSLSDYSDKEEFLQACYELHKDESDPELMFQDWECVPCDLIGESWISESVFSLIEETSEFSDTENEAFLVWCDDFGYKLSEWDASELVEKFRDSYQGEYNSENDFAEQMFIEFYPETPDYLINYIDYDSFARDLFICDYSFRNGFVFRCA